MYLQLHYTISTTLWRLCKNKHIHTHTHAHMILYLQLLRFENLFSFTTLNWRSYSAFFNQINKSNTYAWHLANMQTHTRTLIHKYYFSWRSMFINKAIAANALLVYTHAHTYVHISIDFVARKQTFVPTHMHTHMYIYLWKYLCAILLECNCRSINAYANARLCNWLSVCIIEMPQHLRTFALIAINCHTKEGQA